MIKNNNFKIDLSLIPTHECNLRCWFCMYNSSPDNKNRLNYELTKKFFKTVDWNKINSIGFYGGEISINMELYQNFIDIIPKNIPKFTITNGSWSRNILETLRFLIFIDKNKLRTKVSNTIEHRKYQNTGFLKNLESKMNGDLFIKINDDILGKLLPMGRLINKKKECTMKCQNISKSVFPQDVEAYRMALEPDGNIILQSCDGRYPIIGNYNNSFSEIIQNLISFDYEKCSKEL